MAVFGLLAHASGISESRYRSMQLTTYLLFHSFSRCNEVLLCPAVVTGWLLWWCGDEHVLEGMLNRKVLPSRGFSLLIATSLSYSNSLGRFRSCIVQEMIDILPECCQVAIWFHGDPHCRAFGDVLAPVLRCQIRHTHLCTGSWQVCN